MLELELLLLLVLPRQHLLLLLLREAYTNSMHALVEKAPTVQAFATPALNFSFSHKTRDFITIHFCHIILPRFHHYPMHHLLHQKNSITNQKAQSSNMSSAWEQWGSAKRPTPASGAASATATASAAFQSLLRASPLAAAAVDSPAAAAGGAALKKLWTSARDVTRSAVAAASSPAASTTSTAASASDLEALESGQAVDGDARDGDDDAQADAATASWPLFRRKSDADSSSYLPTMSWCVVYAK